MELSWEYSVIELMNRSFNRIWKKSRGFTDARMKHVLPKRLQMDISMSTFAPVIEKVRRFLIIYNLYFHLFPYLDFIHCSLKYSKHALSQMN